MHDEFSTERSLRVTDKRMLRPIAFRSTKTNQGVVIQLTDTFTIGSARVSFFSPNNVSLFVSIADREASRARDIYRTLITPRLKDNRPVQLEGDDLHRLYDYFEHIQTSVIAIYTAIESMANVAIPNDYTLEQESKSKPGVKEVLDKQAIERWLRTSDKVGDVVPKILGVESPKGRDFWPEFRKLEDIRNDIIHQKTRKRQERVNSTFLNRLLQPEIFSIVKSGFALIGYFCESDISHTFFPLGFGEARVAPVVVADDLDTYLQVIDDE